ncbi:MAG: hypothetical protein RL398_973 [Planctomycetota bacterium]|jgi:DNA-binding response OmpR family regulator
MSTAFVAPELKRAPTTEQRRRPVRLERTTRVLLVEDEPLTAQIFAMALERDGCVVEVARDGLQALRRFRDRRPSLVILDMSLPALSGVEVVRRLRGEGHRDLPILVVSGSPRSAVDLPDAEFGPGAWLQKPVKPRDLVRVARALCGGE